MASEASGTPCIWQDGLDIPLVNALEANFYAVHPETAARSVGSSGQRHDQDLGQSRPAAGVLTDWAKGYSPLFKYEWGPTYEALAALCRRDRRFALRRHSDELRQSGDRRTGDADDRRQHAVAAAGREAPGRIATPAASSIRSPRAAAIPSSRASVSIGRSATSSACRPGPGTSTATRRASEDACLFSFNDLPVIETPRPLSRRGLRRQCGPPGTGGLVHVVR